MKQYFAEVSGAIATLDLEKLELSISYLSNCSKNNQRIFVIGNGGSAALSSHFVTDLIKSGYISGRSINAISLVDNQPLLTATANDFSYEEVFSWQLEQIASASDVLFVISSSGNSENILLAVEKAKDIGMKVISLSGFDGGKVSTISDVALITNSNIGSYGPVEDAHSIVCHYIAMELRKS